MARVVLGVVVSLVLLFIAWLTAVLTLPFMYLKGDADYDAESLMREKRGDG